jgi:hypothetical protein
VEFALRFSPIRNDQDDVDPISNSGIALGSDVLRKIHPIASQNFADNHAVGRELTITRPRSNPAGPLLGLRNLSDDMDACAAEKQKV